MNQLIFLDNFVKLYGFKGLNDYETEITTSDYKDIDKLLQNINGQMSQIKKVFKTSQFNLSRKDYKIDNITLAFSLLKKCLQQAQVPFEIRHTNKCNFMRLIPINNLLMKYIDHKMNDIIHIDEMVLKANKKPKDIDYRKDVLEKYQPLYHIDDKDYYQNEGIELLNTLIKNRESSICGKRKLYIDFCNELRVQDDYIIKEVKLIRNADLVFNFGYKLCNTDNIIENSDAIKEVWFVLGNCIIAKDLSELLEFENAFPLLRVPYQELKLVFLMERNQLDMLLSKKLYVKWYDVMIDEPPRSELVQNNYRYNDHFYFEGNFGTGNMSYITDDKLQYLCRPNNDIVNFTIHGYHDLIYDFKISLVNSRYEVIDDAPDFMEIKFNGMSYYDIKSFTKQSPLPLCSMIYNSVELKITTHIKDCFVKIEYTGKNINEKIKQKLLSTPFHFTKNPIFGLKEYALGGLNQSHIDQGWVHVSELLK